MKNELHLKLKTIPKLSMPGVYLRILRHVYLKYKYIAFVFWKRKDFHKIKFRIPVLFMLIYINILRMLATRCLYL